MVGAVAVSDPRDPVGETGPRDLDAAALGRVGIRSAWPTTTVEKSGPAGRNSLDPDRFGPESTACFLPKAPQSKGLSARPRAGTGVATAGSPGNGS